MWIAAEHRQGRSPRCQHHQAGAWCMEGWSLVSGVWYLLFDHQGWVIIG